MSEHPEPRSPLSGGCNRTTVVITSTATGDQVIISLTGEVDASNAGRLRTALFAHLGDGRTEVLIDITALDFIDCAGLATVRAASVYAEARGGSVRLQGTMQPLVRRIAEVTGVAEPC
ncbi:STAS domain-containing protein [Actinoallomurus purpureus]|uniref:STAS domain-containing protein n=1 Tax=Actinoallomurus purpureus TaxID=478114 RepID=UPI002092538D|nr:STAS domain-containing protein [Actinoallomurus purpureus]MCO6009242.1 STAS domain-containing protein [Actinoallomurus purpureus]